MHGLDLFRVKLIFLISRVIKIPFLIYISWSIVFLTTVQRNFL